MRLSNRVQHGFYSCKAYAQDYPCYNFNKAILCKFSPTDCTGEMFTTWKSNRPKSYTEARTRLKIGFKVFSRAVSNDLRRDTDSSNSSISHQEFRENSIMSILSRLFSGGSKTETSLINPRSFLDCMSIMRECSVHAVTDPDYLIPADPNFKAAMDAVVTCPYCSSELVFGNAVKMHNAQIIVQCPACHTVPAQAKHSFNFA